MENPFFGGIGRERIRVIKNEATESILRRLKGWGMYLYMPNPLLEPGYFNINTKLNIFSLERIPNKDETSGSSPLWATIYLDNIESSRRKMIKIGVKRGNF